MYLATALLSTDRDTVPQRSSAPSDPHQIKSVVSGRAPLYRHTVGRFFPFPVLASCCAVDIMSISLLPSCRRYRSIRTHISRLHDSFYPQAITLLNSLLSHYISALHFSFHWLISYTYWQLATGNLTVKATWLSRQHFILITLITWGGVTVQCIFIILFITTFNV